MADAYLDIPGPPDLSLTDDVVLLSVVPASTLPAGTEMIDKIAVACGLDATTQARQLPLSASAALANWSGLQRSTGATRYVVVYGLSPKHVGAHWTAPRYQWLAVGPVHWCFAERPEVIEQDMERKKVLWGCLKGVG